jgi:hypothetical protein
LRATKKAASLPAREAAVAVGRGSLYRIRVELEAQAEGFGRTLTELDRVAREFVNALDLLPPDLRSSLPAREAAVVEEQRQRHRIEAELEAQAKGLARKLTELDRVARELVNALDLPPPDLMRHVRLQASHDRGRPPPRGSRHDLPHLIEIARLVRDGAKDLAAAEKIAERIGGNARVRHNNKKQLYERFRKGRAVYLRIAQAPDAEACIEKIIEESALIKLPELEALYAILEKVDAFRTRFRGRSTFRLKRE